MLPFTREQFFGVFAAYNAAVWPVQVVAYLLGLAAVVVLLRPSPWGHRLGTGVLAAMWIWTGVAYHGLYFAPINPVALAFGALFVVQGVLFAVAGIVGRRLVFGHTRGWVAALGWGLVAYAALLYPLLGQWSGHVYPAQPTFGITPCPVTLFSFGVLLLTSKPVPWWLLVIPLGWSLVGGSAAFLLGVPQDWPLLFSGLTVVWLIPRDRRAVPTSSAAQAVPAPRHDAGMTSIAEAVLADLARRLGEGTVLRVKALHLPPVPWNGRKDGEFGALELEDGSLGLSYVLLDDSLEALAGGRAAEDLAGADAMHVAAGWCTGRGAARTLGFAAVNAISRHLFDRMGFMPPRATDSIGGLDPRPGERIGMVGFFPPLVRQVIDRGARLTVLELRTDLAGEHAGYRVTLDPKDLHDCDKVLSTSTVLLNHTLDVVLAHCRSARRIALIGPGAGCLPDVLFEAGVTTLGGTWIIDPSGFKQALRQGQPWSRFARKFVLDVADWQGASASSAHATFDGSSR